MPLPQVQNIDLATPLQSLIQSRRENQDRAAIDAENQRQAARQAESDSMRRAEFDQNTQRNTMEIEQFRNNATTKQYIQDALTVKNLLDTGDQRNASVFMKSMAEKYAGTMYGSGLDEDYANIVSGNLEPVLSGLNSEINAYGQMSQIGSSQSKPAAVSEWETFSQMTPEQKQQYLTMKRANPAVNLGDRSVVANPVDPSAAPIAEFQRGVSPDAQPALRGQQQAAVERAEIAAIAPRQQAETAATRATELPQRAASLAAEERKYDLVSGLISRAADGANAWTTGLGGALLGDIPMTAARDLKATVDTIKANIGTAQLQEMRDNSPTGGALGQVTEFENRMLQALLGNLETSQSPDQFKQNLELVQGQLDMIVNGKREQFQRAYPGQSGAQPSQDIFGQADAILGISQ